MTSMDVLDKVISRNSITMRAERVHEAMHLCREKSDEGIEHYRCTLSRPGKQMDVFLPVQTAEGLLSTTDVMFMLVMDAFGCKLLEGYEQFRDEWDSIFAGSDGNLKEVECFWEEYGSRCKQTEQFRNFLGDYVYEDILKEMELTETIPTIL